MKTKLYLFYFLLFLQFSFSYQDECQKCENFITDITPIVKDVNNSIVVLGNITKYLCNLIAPLPIQKHECNILVNLIEAISFDILKGYSPYNICHHLGLC